MQELAIQIAAGTLLLLLGGVGGVWVTVIATRSRFERVENRVTALESRDEQLLSRLKSIDKRQITLLQGLGALMKKEGLIERTEDLIFKYMAAGEDEEVSPP